MPGAFPDVMESENLVVDEAFNEVEETPSNEDPSDKRAAADCPAPPRRSSPEDPYSHGHCDPGTCMEEAVREGIVLETAHRGRRVVIFAAQEVVPLEDLMEDNPVHEPTQTNADQDSWCARTRRLLATGIAPPARCLGRHHGSRLSP